MGMNVVIVGGANIDVCAKSGMTLIEHDSNIGKVEFALGGVGRNIAEDLSLFGADVSLLTAIGNDSFGHVVEDNAREQGITLLAEPFGDAKTGVYAYVADSDGSFVVGINDMDITSRITPQLARDNYNAMFFADYVVIEANIPQNTIEEICKANVKIIADCVSSTKCVKLAGVLDKVYLLKANLYEAKALTGADDCREAVKKLVERGSERGIITLGYDGAMCYEKTNSGIRCLWISNMPDREIVDTSGCGDALLAGFLIAVMRGKSMKEALVLGQSAACLNADSFSSVNRNMTYLSLKDMAVEFNDKTEIKEEII